MDHPSPTAAIDRFAPHAGKPYSLFFDGACPGDPRSRQSFICHDPEEVIEAHGTALTLTARDGTRLSVNGQPFDIVRERLEHYAARHAQKADGEGFKGGAAGYFGYDLGRTLEKIPSRAAANPALPDMRVGIYLNAAAFPASLKANDASPYAPSLPLHWTPDCSEAEYLQKIRSAIALIYAGELYQVNLSRRFDAALPRGFDPFAHYRHLRAFNPAPFSAYMNFGDMQISSCSPERFLKVTGQRVETRPIKGTLPASRPAQELLNSEKDRAENLMIVDLMRNDLSRVCELRSVTVSELFTVETFKGLHHLVSEVRGTLKSGLGATDLLKACFPGGSITGAPKIRAMEVIEEREPQLRGPYCGAIGYIGFDGAMDTAITIRTLIYHNGRVYLQTGSGIVADSDPKAELQETLDKTDMIFRSFESPQGKKKAHGR